MRKFHGYLFLGNGKFSERQEALLRRRLREAFELNAGLEQGAGFGEFDPPGFKERLVREIEDIVRDIAAALTGRRISFGRKLPYPPKEPK